MSQRKTNRGQIIDFDALLAQQGDKPAVGNMGTDGKGNVLGPGGQVVQSNEQRVRKYLKDNPTVSNDAVSLKTNEPIHQDVTAPDIVETKTAATAKENVRTQVQPDPEPSAPLGEDFDEQEPLGYKEVELPNGDIEMVPYYTQEDAPDANS
jgi:hypothetical protein